MQTLVSCKENDYKMAGSLLESTLKEAQMKQSQIEHDHEINDGIARKELEKLLAELAATDEIISRWKGSLYEWLTENKPGWETTIGKVVDEQSVLYAQGLSPEFASGTDNGMFGISINLDAIPQHHRTLDDYKDLQKSQREAVETKKRELREMQKQKEATITSLQKEYNQRLQELRQQKTNINVELQQLPLKIKDAQTRLHNAERDERQLISQERERRQTIYNEAQLKLDKEKTLRNKRRLQHDNEVKDSEHEYKTAIDALQKRFDAFSQNQKKEAEQHQADIDSQRKLMEQRERDELKGVGADTNAIDVCRKEITGLQDTLDKIAKSHDIVVGYRNDVEELFSHEKEHRDNKLLYEAQDKQAQQACEEKCNSLNTLRAEEQASLDNRATHLKEMTDGLKQYEQFRTLENVVPEKYVQDDIVEKTTQTVGELVGLMRGAINRKRQKQEELKRAVNAFNVHFSANNTFHFIAPQYDEEYMAFALNLQDFIDNNKIETYRQRLSEHYNSILQSVSREIGVLTSHTAEIRSIINDVNRDFRERNFAGVIRSIELRAEDSSDKLVQLLKSIRDFIDDNALSIGEVNLFSGNERDKVNERVVDYLKKFMRQLQREPSRTELTLSDTFRLQFRIEENDNSTGWVERISNVGSDGTDILVKAMVNIMLINVFKTKASRKNGDFVIHCMLDEIGKLHPSNVKGILQFANVRNIYLINSSPMGYNADIYKYNYLLTKDSKAKTHIKRLLTIM